MDKYVNLAKDYKMLNAVVISPEDIYFDMRAILKCHWGCEDFFNRSVKCHSRNTTPSERIDMIKKYKHILVVHSHDAGEISNTLIKLEKIAFLDGYYFAFALSVCSLCESCFSEKGEKCPKANKVRPCEQMFCIDVYKTVRDLGFPCNVLKNKEQVQNRYGFLLID